MAHVPTAPRTARSLDGDRRRLTADVARIDRRRQPPPVIIPFVRVSPHEVQDWPVGTLWLDTLTRGPLGAHPLSVKRDGGIWDQVAWMVPA